MDIKPTEKMQSMLDRLFNWPEDRPHPAVMVQPIIDMLADRTPDKPGELSVVALNGAQADLLTMFALLGLEAAVSMAKQLTE